MWIAFFLRAAVRVACIFLAAGVLVIAYLSWIGFPGAVSAWVKAEVSQRGLLLDFDRLRLNVLRGVVADQVQIFDETGEGQIMTCDTVCMNLNWHEAVRQGEWLQGLGVENGIVYPGALSILPSGLDRPWLAISNLNTFIALESHAFRMKPFHARLCGLPVEGQGMVVRTPGLQNLFSGSKDEADGAAQQKDFQALADRIESLVQGLQWSQDSRMNFDFSISPGNHSSDRVRIKAEGLGVKVRNQQLHNWSARLSLVGQTLVVEEVSAGQKENRARLSGSLDLQERMVELHAYSGLNPSCVLALIPWSWAETVGRKVDIQRGGLETECWVGPVPLKDASSSITGWTKIKKSTCQGIWIEEGFGAWKREDSLFHLTDIHFRCGEGRAEGEVSGDFQIDTSTREWTCNLTTTLDPHVLLPITPTNLVKLTGKFEFTSSNPTVSLRLEGRGQPRPRIAFSGRFEAEDFSYQGVPGLRTESGIQYSNKLLRLDPFYVVRDEGEVYGWLEVDGRQKFSNFELNSSIHPQALGQIVSTNIGRLVRRLGVEGVGQWSARGRADLGAGTNSNFEVQTRLRNAEVWRFQSKDLNVNFSSISTNLQFLIYDTELYGGSLTGKIDIAQTDPERNYAAWFSLADVGFDQMLSLFREREASLIEGKVTGQSKFTGTLKPFQLPGTTGEGAVRISEGTLFRLPILGGLSVLMSKIFPGLGFSAQRDLTASFQLRDEKIYSDDLEISGTAASIQMDGRYHFGQDLDFDVKAKPLGRGMVADVVQLLTLPISKLLEFNLQGTLDNPVWKAKHWPKELTLSLDQDENLDE